MKTIQRIFLIASLIQLNQETGMKLLNAIMLNLIMRMILMMYQRI